MKIDISLFLGVLFSLILFFLIISFSKERKKIFSLRREDKIKVLKCPVCLGVYFVLQKEKYSYCPFCLSINKIEDDH